MRALFMFTLAAAAALMVSGILSAEGGDEDRLAGYKSFVERIQRDCPACGYNGRTKKSSNKPSKSFVGVFEPGTTCPVCNGAGVLYDVIDWRKGEVRTIGAVSSRIKKPIKDAKARFGQEKLMSERGAKAVALRNAAAAVLEVRLFGDKKMPSSYNRSVSAYLRGFKVTDVKNLTSGSRPAAVAKITIPLWGIQGVTGHFFDSERRRYVQSYGGPRSFRHVDAVDEDSYDEDTTVVIDMRGTDFTPHLFPSVEDEDGGAVYNITSVAKSRANTNGVTSYIYMKKDGKTFNELKSELEAGLLELRKPDRMFAIDEVDCSGLCGEKPRRKKKKRIVIIRGKTKKASGRTRVIVSGEDAKKMAEADKKGGAKKKGNVVIISDSRIAGKQGMVFVRTKKRFALK